MVDYITKSDLVRQVRGISEQASVVRKAETASPTGSTFLSHSSKDKDLLPGAIQILERHGATVYTDKKDESLPPYTSTETAEILKGRIHVSKKFVLLTTAQSKDSRWVPWELGLADGYKTVQNTAIFPSVDSQADTKWAEREYLGIYRRIVYGRLEGHPTDVFMVWNMATDKATELRKWLAS